MSSSDDKEARKAILRRRALFISSVTALSGCAPTAPAGTTPGAGTSPVVKVEPTPGAGMPKPAGSSVGSPQPKTKMPSLETPAGVNKDAKNRFDWLRESVLRLHEKLDKAEREVPRDCPIIDAACDARWLSLAKSLLAIEEAMPKTPVCPGTSDGAKQYEVRVKEHQSYANARKEDISKAIQAQVGPLGDAGKARWEAHMSAARAAFPRVCLNYSCRDW